MATESQALLLLEELRRGTKELRSAVKASEQLLARTWDLLEATAPRKVGDSVSAQAWRNVPGLLSARSSQGTAAGDGDLRKEKAP